MKIWLTLCAVFFLASPALAQEHQFRANEPVSIKQDSAYLLIRTFDADGGGIRGTLNFGPMLVRPLSQDELAQAEKIHAADPDHWKDKVDANVVEPLPSATYLKQGNEGVLLVAVKPGTYVLAGVVAANWASTDVGGLLVSLCMGTVKFEARAGVITDLGELLTARDDQPSTIPELAQVVTGKRTELTDYFPNIFGIRPVNDQSLVPQPLAGLPHAAADYRAMGPYPNYAGARLGRLAPMPGVLDYDTNGDVVDLKKK